MLPKGFDNLVKMAIKERPKHPKTSEEIWKKMLPVIFMGGKRSEPDIIFVINMLNNRKLLALDNILKINAEDWRDAVIETINERTSRMQDEDLKIMLKEMQKEIFRLSASIKGSARFVEKLGPKKLADMLDTKEKTWKFIEDMANNQDVSNIKYTKIIIWIHSMGYGFDFCPPSWQTKSFLNNEIGPYYQFYEDDKYFMEKASELTEEVKKQVKAATARDVSAAIYYYMMLKSVLPPRSPLKKKCTPEAVVKFMIKKKLTLTDLSNASIDAEEKEKMLNDFFHFLNKS